jgi:hypothetical protein
MGARMMARMVTSLAHELEIPRCLLLAYFVPRCRGRRRMTSATFTVVSPAYRARREVAEEACAPRATIFGRGLPCRGCS